MPLTHDARDFQTKLQRLDALIQEMERSADPAARDRTREIVQSVLDLHGTGLEHILAHLEEGGAATAPVFDACVRDDVVSGLLLLHSLHPLDMEARVLEALEHVRPYLRSHGGNVQLLEIVDGTVRLRLEGSCHGCPSSSITMKQTIEEAIYAKAPDVTAIEVEGDAADAPSLTPDGRALVTLKVS